MSTPAFKLPTKPAVDPAKLAQFAAGAEVPGGQAGKGATPPAATTQQSTEPPIMLAALDNKRRVARFSMRLTDREAAQLQHLADTTPDSMHEFCLKAVQKALAEKFPEAGQGV
jgi:hypothetical protein